MPWEGHNDLFTWLLSILSIGLAIYHLHIETYYCLVQTKKQNVTNMCRYLKWDEIFEIGNVLAKSDDKIIPMESHSNPDVSVNVEISS